MPLIQRLATIGVIVGAVAGGVGGLIRDLDVHPASAWFAILELGVPGAVAGGVIGLCCGVAVTAGRRIRRIGTPPPG